MFISVLNNKNNLIEFKNFLKSWVHTGDVIGKGAESANNDARK
jgi:hypothetical protein